MKKTKLIASTVSLAVAGVLCIGLTACGGSSPASMKGEEVTAQQWADAFKADNFKNVKIEAAATQEGESEAGEKFKITTTMTYIITENAQYSKMEAKVNKGPQELKDMEGSVEAYSSASEGDYSVFYVKDAENKWQMILDEDSVVYGVIAQFTGMASMYDKFEYVPGGTVKGYWLKDEYSQEYPSLFGMRYKFKDGKLAAVYYPPMENQAIGATVTQSMTITYGNQTVALPTVEGVAAYVGTWETYQLIVNGQTIELNGQLGPDETLTADYIKVEAKIDGTATFTSPDGTGSGIWGLAQGGIQFCSEDMGEYPINIEYDGTYLTMPIGSTVSVVLKKA